MSVALSDLLKRPSMRHIHLCPRQVLGVHTSLAGLDAIGLEAPMPHKATLVIIESDGCFTDGIEVSTSAMMGHRTLRLADQGKIADTFVYMKIGVAVRLAPRLDIRQRALAYAPDVKKKYYAQLKGYQVMPVVELFFLRKSF